MNAINKEFVNKGRLVQCGESFRAGLNTKRHAVFECECGRRVILCVHNVKTGHTRSCGCLNDECRGNRVRKHSMSNSAIYRVHQSMINRCHNPNTKAFRYYGARGISVCSRWRDFQAFIEDMGIPASGQQIDRINPNGNYEPGNCRWVSVKQQQRNKRSNRIIQFNGMSLCMAEWAEKTGIPIHVIHKRIKVGWTVDTALTKPVRVMRKAAR